MPKTLFIYPAVLMITLTLFLYVKSYLDSVKAKKSDVIKFSYFKTYKGEAPDYLEVSRQTLKNQFELPILFYFLTSMILIFDNNTILDLIFSWLFVISRYMHCYIRLTSNYVPNRAKAFKFGICILIVWWIKFLVVTL